VPILGHRRCPQLVFHSYCEETPGGCRTQEIRCIGSIQYDDHLGQSCYGCSHHRYGNFVGLNCAQVDRGIILPRRHVPEKSVSLHNIPSPCIYCQGLRLCDLRKSSFLTLVPFQLEIEMTMSNLIVQVALHTGIQIDVCPGLVPSCESL